MSDTDLALLFFGIPAVLAAGTLLIWGIEWLLWQAENITVRCQDSFNSWRHTATQKFHENTDRQAFLAWVAARTGTTSSGNNVDDRLVEAQQLAEVIRILIEDEIPKAALSCVETHRLMARVTGAYHLSEIAYEPECHQLRTSMVWILSHTTALLDGYPLRMDDKRLLHNSIVLKKRALPTCRRCPYIQLQTDEAPHLCPTAELVQIKTGRNQGSQA